MTKEEKVIHEGFLTECNKLALESYDFGDLPFGALLVKDERIIVRSHNTGLKEVTGHAEVNALKAYIAEYSSADLKNCTLYTNFEPCAMCAYLIRDYGVGRVVYSVPSPHVGGLHRWSILTDNIPEPFTTQGIENGPIVIGGLLSEESSKIFDKLEWKMHSFPRSSKK